MTSLLKATMNFTTQFWGKNAFVFASLFLLVSVYTLSSCKKESDIAGLSTIPASDQFTIRYDSAYSFTAQLIPDSELSNTGDGISSTICGKKTIEGMGTVSASPLLFFQLENKLPTEHFNPPYSLSLSLEIEEIPMNGESATIGLSIYELNDTPNEAEFQKNKIDVAGLIGSEPLITQEFTIIEEDTDTDPNILEKAKPKDSGKSSYVQTVTLGSDLIFNLPPEFSEKFIKNLLDSHFKGDIDEINKDLKNYFKGFAIKLTDDSTYVHFGSSRIKVEFYETLNNTKEVYDTTNIEIIDDTTIIYTIDTSVVYDQDYSEEELILTTGLPSSNSLPSITSFVYEHNESAVNSFENDTLSYAYVFGGQSIQSEIKIKGLGSIFDSTRTFVNRAFIRFEADTLDGSENLPEQLRLKFTYGNDIELYGAVKNVNTYQFEITDFFTTFGDLTGVPFDETKLSIHLYIPDNFTTLNNAKFSFSEDNPKLIVTSTKF